jgi:hypothetical protein
MRINDENSEDMRVVIELNSSSDCDPIMYNNSSARVEFQLPNAPYYPNNGYYIPQDYFYPPYEYQVRPHHHEIARQSSQRVSKKWKTRSQSSIKRTGCIRLITR